MKEHEGENFVFIPQEFIVHLCASLFLESLCVKYGFSFFNVLPHPKIIILCFPLTFIIYICYKKIIFDNYCLPKYLQLFTNL